MSTSWAPIMEECDFCYATPLGQQIQSEIIKSFKYWDLVPQPEQERLKLGRIAAGLLIASPSRLGHIGRERYLPDAAVVERVRIKKDAAHLLVVHFGLDGKWKGGINTGVDEGCDSGEQELHTYEHIMPVITQAGDVGGGTVQAYQALKISSANLPKW